MEFGFYKAATGVDFAGIKFYFSEIFVGSEPWKTLQPNFCGIRIRGIQRDRRLCSDRAVYLLFEAAIRYMLNIQLINYVSLDYCIYACILDTTVPTCPLKPNSITLSWSQ